MAEYKENDNRNVEEIEKFMKMSQDDRDRLMKEKEEEALKKISKAKHP